MDNLILRYLHIYKPLNLACINQVLKGETNVLRGEARDIITKAGADIKSGIDNWGDNHPDQLKRQHKKLEILKEALKQKEKIYLLSGNKLEEI